MKFNSVVLALSLVVSTPSVLAQNSTTGTVTGSSSIVAGSLLIQNNLNVLVAAIQAQLLSALALLHANSTTSSILPSSTSNVTSAISPTSTYIASNPYATSAVPVYVPGTIQLTYPGGQGAYYSNYTNFGSYNTPGQGLQVGIQTTDGTCANMVQASAQMILMGSSGFLAVSTNSSSGFLLSVANSSTNALYDSNSGFMTESTIFQVNCSTGALSVYINMVQQGPMCYDSNDSTVYVLSPGYTCNTDAPYYQTTMMPYFIPNSPASFANYTQTTAAGVLAVSLGDGATRGASYFNMPWYSSISLYGTIAQAATVTLATSNGTCRSLSTSANLDLLTTAYILSPDGVYYMSTAAYLSTYTTLAQPMSTENNTAYMGILFQESTNVTASAPYSNVTVYGQSRIARINCTTGAFNYYFNNAQVWAYGNYNSSSDTYTLTFYPTNDDTIAVQYGDYPWNNTFVPANPSVFWS